MLPICPSGYGSDVNAVSGLFLKGGNMKSRAYRRHQQDRAKGRAKRYLRDRLSFPPEELTDRRIGKHAANLTLCSCYACGNQRKHFGEVTRQELRAM